VICCPNDLVDLSETTLQIGGPFPGPPLLIRDFTTSQATVLAHEDFKDFIESYELDFKPLSGSVEEVLHSPDGKKALLSGSSIAALKYIAKIGRKNQKRINQDILRGCEAVDTIVSSALGVLWICTMTGVKIF
jgi:hypothetical protein